MTIPFSRPYDRKTKEGMVILRMFFGCRASGEKNAIERFKV